VIDEIAGVCGGEALARHPVPLILLTDPVSHSLPDDPSLGSFLALRVFIKALGEILWQMRRDNTGRFLGHDSNAD
jgi:hypothetical protein